jgi:hypothetical protein
MNSGCPPDNTTPGRPVMREADRFRDLVASERQMVEEAMDITNYNGPATIVTVRGEIEVIVDLRAEFAPDDCMIWGGHVDRDDRGELDRAMYEMSPYGLVIRLPDGREGNFMPGPETSVSVRGFMRRE